MARSVTRLLCMITLTFGVLAASAGPAVAEDPDATLTFPAGVACSFELQIDVFGAPTVQREFTDRDGNVVRTLTAGRGSLLVFTNLDTDETLTLRPNGAVDHITLNPDGTSTHMSGGHLVVILFPTDVPPGPSTVLYVGRLVFTVDASGNFTVQSFSGVQHDICAALAP